jgi:ABC-type lipoprotein release transport system permease subunit
MSLFRFKYLRRQRILTLIVILTLTSTLFSITAYSFFGFYNGFTSYVGEGKDIIAIYSKISRSPFSGLVPIAITNEIAGLKGVIATSPETIAPCIINGKSVFIRGVLPQELSKLNVLTLIQGDNLNLNDTNSAIIGKSLSERLNLKTGDKIILLSVLSEKYVQLQVKGIFQSHSSLDDEAIVPIYIGQWLRGVSYNEVTLVRAKINLDQTSANQLYQEVVNKTAPTTASPSPTPKSEARQELETLVPLMQTNLNTGNIGIEAAQQFMTNYLDRYGISKDAIVILSFMVLILASGTATCAVTLFIKQHASDIDIIRSIGVSRRKLKIDLSIKMLIWSLIATTMGTLISATILIIFQQLGYLLVLSHAITFQLDPLIIAANFILISALISINIARTELKQ